MTSYLDQNFKIDCLLDDGKFNVFNFKILNSQDSQNEDLISILLNLFKITSKNDCKVYFFQTQNMKCFFNYILKVLNVQFLIWIVTIEVTSI